jgi:hypothetical protein
MTIAEMHVWFRQYAQQMGMQNVRAILPEQIDNLINTSTLDTIDEVINRNVGTTNDRIITDNAKIANVNALRTLYKVKTINILNGQKLTEYKNKPYIFGSGTLEETPLYYVDFAIRYGDRAFDGDNVDDIEYTRWFPIRIVDDSYLADILNDWVLAPRLRTPAMVIYADDIVGDSKFELYVGENEETGIKDIAASKYLCQIRCSYIKKPRQIAYLSDVGGTNIDSDLPVQLQIPMLKHAVDLYRVSIQGSLYANQQNTQQAQQEAVRNEARPTNEGYQS